MKSQRTRTPRPNASPSSTGSLAIQSVLLELAAALIPRGVTPTTFTKLSKHAFVHAAAAISLFQNGKVNQSRVAVLTGLQRREVRALLNRSQSQYVREAPALSPIDIVINGWTSDQAFLDRSGRPASLKVRGPRGSFSKLVKRYARDLPHRAVLDEMCRLGAIRKVGSTVSLSLTSKWRAARSFKSLNAVLPILIDGIRHSSKTENSKGSSLHRISIPARSQLDLSIVRARCFSNVVSVLTGVSESLRGPANARQSKNSPYACALTVLISDTLPPSLHVPISKQSTDTTPSR